MNHYTTQTTLGEQFHCSLTHIPTGESIATEAPVEKGGTGTSFSPPELLGASLSACMMSMLHYAATSRGFDLSGTTAKTDVKEENLSIKSIDIEIYVPKSVPEDIQKILQTTADHCPVHKALEKGVQITTQWVWAK